MIWVKITAEVVLLKYGRYMTHKSTFASGFTRGTSAGLLGESLVCFDWPIHPDFLPSRCLLLVHVFVDYIQIIYVTHMNYGALLFVGIATNSVWEQPDIIWVGLHSSATCSTHCMQLGMSVCGTYLSTEAAPQKKKVTEGWGEMG